MKHLRRHARSRSQVTKRLPETKSSLWAPTLLIKFWAAGMHNFYWRIRLLCGWKKWLPHFSLMSSKVHSISLPCLSLQNIPLLTVLVSNLRIRKISRFDSPLGQTPYFHVSLNMVSMFYLEWRSLWITTACVYVLFLLDEKYKIITIPKITSIDFSAWPRLTAPTVIVFKLTERATRSPR